MRQGAWALHEWACQPYFTLIAIFIFAPYFSTHVIGDPVRGQAAWGYVQASAGFAVLIAAPLLGAMADASGRRKPWILASAVLAVGGCALLWTALPGAPVWPIVIALILVVLGIETLYVFANAMLPGIASARRLGLVSGLGIALGQLAGLVSLVIVLLAFALPGQMEAPFVPAVPLFGLDPAAHETDRIVGPLVALWLAIFLLPLLVLVPDIHSGTAMRVTPLVRAARDRLMRSLGDLRAGGDVARFLLARLIFYSGMNMVFLFGGVLGAGLFAWGLEELTLLGLLASLMAAIGALGAGLGDRHAGARQSLVLALGLSAVAVLVLLSVEPGQMFFVLTVAVPTTEGLFASAPERVFLAAAAVFSLGSGVVIAASRTLMAQLAPRDRLAASFGLYAMVAQMTGFAAPLAVGVMTDWAGSQRAGLALAVPLILVGMALLRRAGARS